VPGEIGQGPQRVGHLHDGTRDATGDAAGHHRGGAPAERVCDEVVAVCPRPPQRDEEAAFPEAARIGGHAGDDGVRTPGGTGDPAARRALDLGQGQPQDDDITIVVCKRQMNP